MDSQLFLELYKDNLKPEISEIDVEPCNYKETYSDLSMMVGKLEFKEWVVSPKPELQVIKFKNDRSISLILKRFCLTNCTLSLDKVLFNENSKKFINRALKEYCVSKLISAHPAGIFPFDFQVTLLTSKHILVGEFLMEDGGTSLDNLLRDPTDNTKYIKIEEEIAIKYLKQTSSVLSFMEMVQIAHKDIKLANFVVDKKENIRIIDFDIAQVEQIGLTEKYEPTHISLGHSKGYVSPEALQFSQKYNSKKLDSKDVLYSWKADIYSWGIFALIILHVIKDINFLHNLDKKKTFEDHLQIENLVDKIKLSDSNLSEKIKFILRKCIKFNPCDRIRFKELNKLMKGIHELSLEGIESECNKYFRNSVIKENPLAKIKELHIDLAKAEELIIELQKKNGILEAELTKSNQETKALEIEINLMKSQLEIIKKENEELNISLNNAEIAKFKIERRGSSFRNQKEIKLIDNQKIANQSFIFTTNTPKIVEYPLKIGRTTTNIGLSSPIHLIKQTGFEEIGELEESMNHQYPNFEDLITKVRTLERENCELIKENKQYKIYVDVYKDFIKSNSNENFKLKGLNEQLKSDFEKLKLQAKEKEREVKNAELIQITYSKELEKADDKIKKLIGKKENLQKENDLLQKSCSEYNTKLEKITTENEILHNVKMENEINCNNMKSKLDLLGKDNNEFTKEISIQKSNISQIILEKKELEKIILTQKGKLNLFEEKHNKYNEIENEILKIITDNQFIFKNVYKLEIYKSLQDFPSLLKKIVFTSSGNMSPIKFSKPPQTPGSGRDTPRKDLFTNSPSKFPNCNNPNKCPICQLNQDYEGIKGCITNSDKLRKQIIKLIAGDKYWDLSTDVIVLEKNEIQLIISMIFSSNIIQGIDFGRNSNFDEILGKYYLEAISRNESLDGIILFKNNISLNFKFNALKTFISKKKMKFFVIDKIDINKDKAEEVAKINNLEIVESWPNSNLPTSDFPQFWNQHNLSNLWFFCKKENFSSYNENFVFHY